MIFCGAIYWILYEEQWIGTGAYSKVAILRVYHTRKQALIIITVTLRQMFRKRSKRASRSIFRKLKHKARIVHVRV